MERVDPQQNVDSTRRRPVWRWRIRFFASVCLFAFMIGLMLGKLLKPDQSGRSQLLTVDVEESGLRVCFSRLPKAAVIRQEGAFVMLLAVAPTDGQEGTLRLATGHEASWYLNSRSDGMQLGVIGLQPVQGRWHKEVDGSPCIRIRIQSSG